MKTKTILLTIAFSTLISWSSNAQVVMVKNLKTSSETSRNSPDDAFGKFSSHYLTNVNGTLYFIAEANRPSSETSSGNENYSGLWKTDGTENGTVFIGAIRTASIININSTLYFFAASPTISNRAALWKYDGTDKSSTVKEQEKNNDKEKEPEKEKSGFGKKFSDKLKENITVNNEPLKEKEKTNSSNSQGSSNIKGLETISESLPFANVSNPGFLSNVNGTLYFVVNLGGYKVELWKSDGTAKGTVGTGIKGSISGDGRTDLNQLINVNGTLYFTKRDDVHGLELWKTDGTTAGTVMFNINQVYTSTGGTQGSDPSALTNVNGTLFFVANDGVHGRELWKSNGTAEGTVMVKDLGENDERGGNSSKTGNVDIGYNSNNFTSVNNILYFTIGTYLWKSDGTSAGTVMVKDLKQGKKQANGSIYYNQGAGTSSNFTNVNGTLFFSLHDGLYGSELWKSNGTSAGTVMVKNINTNPPSSGGEELSSSPYSLINVNGTLFFSADDGVHGVELWKSDGTASGTVMVSDIKPFGNFGSEPKDLIYINGTLYFTADDGPHGRELWKYDTSNPTK